MRVKVQRGVAGQTLPLLARGDEGEALGLYSHPRPLHMLLYVPVDERGLARRMVA